MKFIPEDQKEEVPHVEVVREGSTTKARLIYPKPKRTSQEYDEYDDEDNSQDL